MTAVLTPPPPGAETPPADDVPMQLRAAPSGPDRVFSAVLAAASAVVLLILTAIVVFLCYYGWPALKEAGIGFLTDLTWSPDTGHFGLVPLLVGSLAIALIGVAIATPVSLATALMINEYAPRRLKPFLTGVIDLLATVPSIVYGFWGLELISPKQVPPPSGWPTISGSSRSSGRRPPAPT